MAKGRPSELNRLEGAEILWAGFVTMKKADSFVTSMLGAVISVTLFSTAALALPQYSLSGEVATSAIAAAPSLHAGQKLQRNEQSGAIATRPQKPFVQKTSVQKPFGSVLASRGGSSAGSPRVSQETSQTSAEQERVLLAQLDADLLQVEKRLDTTGSRLSAGQKELMSLTSTLRAVMSESGEDGAGLHPFVRVASRYAGTPYVWGGESRYGFDCSGLIIRVMRDLGYKALPHSAAEQFKYGTPIAQNLLKPGDIVFFANTYKPGISHVGIYIGKRRFIHAANTRQGTIVSSLDASPYREKYAGARRLNVIAKQ